MLRRKAFIVFAALTTLAAALSPAAWAANIDFTKQIQPIFMQHCAGCHGEKKGLGGLRLHSPAAIEKKSAKDDHLIVKGDPDKSELIERMVLPVDHKKFMPKKGKPLPAEQLSLIRQWIKEGAAYTVSAKAKPTEEPAPDEGHVKEGHGEHHSEPAKEIPLPEVAAADAAAIEKLVASGAQVSSLYTGSSLLQVSYALRSEPATDAEVALLSAVAEQVYALNLAKSQVSNKGLAVLSQLKNLAQLHLENSSVTDSSLSHLSGLTSLKYLNLYGTSITDAGLKPLEGLEHLQKLYVWKTKVSYEKAKAMEKAKAGMLVDLGFDHPVVVRKRVTKQLEEAKKQVKSSDAAFKKAKQAYERSEKEQKASKQRLDELQKQLDAIEGKVKPEAKEKKAEEKKEEKKK